VEFDHAAGEDELDHLDHLVDALAALGVRLAAPLEFLRRPADPDAEPEAVVGEVGHRPDLAGQQQRIAGAELHHVGVEPQRRRHRAHRTRGDQRVHPWGVFVPHPRTVRGIRIICRLLLHVEQRIRQGYRVEPDFLGALGDLDELVNRAHRDAAGVLHGLSAGLSELTTHME
jgi:hypothetical protein